MVQHVVMWTFKPEVDKPETVKKLKETFAGFEQKVPGLQEISVHGGYQGYDACLISLHQDAAALEAYQTHPAHIAAKGFVHSVVEGRASCDFEL